MKQGSYLPPIEQTLDLLPRGHDSQMGRRLGINDSASLSPKNAGRVPPANSPATGPDFPPGLIPVLQAENFPLKVLDTLPSIGLRRFMESGLQPPSYSCQCAPRGLCFENLHPLGGLSWILLLYPVAQTVCGTGWHRFFGFLRI